MTTSTDPKRRITVEASNQLRRMAMKPGYVTELERAVGAPAQIGPFDNAGGAFPFDVPSEAFDFHLRKLDELINQAEHQVKQLRALADSIRSVAEGRSEQSEEPHDPSIHEPPPPPERAEGEPTIKVNGIDTGMTMREIEATAVEIRSENGNVHGVSIDEVHVQPAEPIAPVSPPPAMTWTCPVHGQYAEAVSRKGRPYRYCPLPDCGRLDIMGLPQ